MKKGSKVLFQGEPHHVEMVSTETSAKDGSKQKTFYIRHATTGKSNIAYKHDLKAIKEEAPANAVGGGHVAGLGIGPQGEPAGISKMKKLWRRYLEGVKK